MAPWGLALELRWYNKILMQSWLQGQMSEEQGLEAKVGAASLDGRLPI